MIVAAFLLVLLGTGLFIAGLLTGVTVLYWACVAACVTAAVLLLVARRQMAPAASSTQAPPAAGAEPTSSGGGSAAAEPAAATTSAESSAVGVAAEPVAAGATAGGAPPAPAAADEPGDPPVEEVEVTDLLLVVDLKDEVLVVDEHPRYHVPGCAWLGGRTTVPIPLDEARTDGFTPCGVCQPDATLADRVRAKKHSADT